jgi:hypothetical protein
MMTRAGPTPESRIGYTWRLALARAPNHRETEVLLNAFRQFEHYYRNDSAAAVELLNQGDSPWNRALDPAELAAYTGVASLILNLDEMVTKQ